MVCNSIFSRNRLTPYLIDKRHVFFSCKLGFLLFLLSKAYMMQLLQCLILEDDKIDLLLLQAIIKKFPLLNIAYSTDSPSKAASYIESNKIDVLFLDIDLNNESGLAFRKQFLEISICIFISAFKEYALDSFEVDSLDFIEKPIKKERFQITYERILKYNQLFKNQENFDANFTNGDFLIKEGSTFLKVQIKNISHIESLKDYTIIYTKKSKHYILMGLSNVLKQHQFSHFIRVHKSYAVQKTYVKSINTKYIILINDILIPIGRVYKENVKEKMLQ
jgi:DNA-binding LytR/AlgR family response regulator